MNIKASASVICAVFSCLCALARPGGHGGDPGDMGNGVPAYTVRYWFNDGSGNYCDEYYGYGGWVPLTFWLGDDGEAEFTGWATSPDYPFDGDFVCDVELEYADSYYDPGSISSQSLSGVEVYAVWRYPPEETVISFNANGGVGTMPDQSISPALATNALDACTFSRKGYDFIGWSESWSGYEAEFLDGEDFSQCAYKEKYGYRNYYISLYAIWQRAEGSAIVSFNANGGSGKMPDQMFVAGESEALSTNAFSRSGYLFTGWATSPNGVVVYRDGEVLSPTEDMTLYPVWLDAKPTLSSSGDRFSSSGGKGSFRVVDNPVGEWTAVAGQDWLSFTIEGDTVHYTVNANSQYRSRIGRIYISNGVGNTTFTITQEPKSVSFNVSQTSFQFDGTGGTGRIAVNTASEVCWWVEWSSGWVDFPDVDFEEDGLCGSHQVRFTVEPCTAGTQRSATVWVFWECGTLSGEKRIDIEQTAGDDPEPPIDTDFLLLDGQEDDYVEMTAESQRISLMVECSAPWGWTAETFDDWIVLETMEGPCLGELSFWVTEHWAGPPREGSITVRMECYDGNIITRTVTVVQEPFIHSDEEIESGSCRWVCDVFDEGSQWVTLVREWILGYGYDDMLDNGVFFARIAIPARESCRVWIEGGDSENITMEIESATGMGHGSFEYSADGKSAVTPFDGTREEYEQEYYFIRLCGDIGASTTFGWSVVGIEPEVLDGDPEFDFIGGYGDFLGRLVSARLNGHRDIEVPAGALDVGAEVFANTALRSVTFPSSLGMIGDGVFLNCASLENVTFLGDAPDVAGSAFDGVDVGCCRVFVRRGSKGWGCEIPGIWNGLSIEYLDAFPELDESLPDETAIQTALADMEDEKLKCNVSDRKTYEAFREWADTVLGNGAMPSEIEKSQTVWQSFILDCDTLLQREIGDEDVSVDGFSADTDGFSMEISIDKVSVGDKADGERLKHLFGIEGSTSLDLKSFKSEYVSLVEGEAANGKVRLTAEPSESIRKNGKPDSFFMRVRVNK